METYVLRHPITHLAEAKMNKVETVEHVDGCVDRKALGLWDNSTEAELPTWLDARALARKHLDEGIDDADCTCALDR